MWLFTSTCTLSLACLALSLRALKRRRIIDDTPTSKTTGVFIGTVELKGHAFTEQPLISHIAELECVHFSWSVEERWQKTVRESYTDSNGKTQWRTHTESGWKTVASGSESIPFLLQDDHGQILVHPQGADLRAAALFSQTCTPDQSLYFAKGPDSEVSHSTHERRFTESAITKGAEVYVIGQARERSDVVAAEIADAGDASMFIISVCGEEGVRSSLGWSIRAWFLSGAMLAYATQRILPGTSGDSEWFIHSIGPITFTLLWALAWTVAVFNSIVGLRHRVEQAASNIDVMLKRRNDLIPALLNSVQACVEHEGTLQEHLARLRHLSAHTNMACAPEFSAIAESYPKLQSDTSFLSLQKELSATETRISLARAYYVDIASFFNTRTDLIPDRWICNAIQNLRPFPLDHSSHPTKSSSP